MFCKIKSFLSVMGLKPSDININLKASPIGIEDEKAVEQRKRIAKAFEMQHESLQARALVAHGADCDDPLFCAKQKCFIWEPDKIVADSLKTVLGRPPVIKVETRGRKPKKDVDSESKKE
jgi:hypothetical protein